ncbi:unnamed protein product [Paramecium octaurelia]|uniref:Uncharacterized protein n=1 Tax=Paramecium octaurelia TaxID=43137 RepID=A0A8S1VYZ3_PAROT|nr:unnamed protein product [Paramecium octaurelia]
MIPLDYQFEKICSKDIQAQKWDSDNVKLVQLKIQIVFISDNDIKYVQDGVVLRIEISYRYIDIARSIDYMKNFLNLFKFMIVEEYFMNQEKGAQKYIYSLIISGSQNGKWTELSNRIFKLFTSYSLRQIQEWEKIGIWDIFWKKEQHPMAKNKFCCRLVTLIHKQPHFYYNLFLMLLFSSIFSNIQSCTNNNLNQMAKRLQNLISYTILLDFQLKNQVLKFIMKCFSQIQRAFIILFQYEIL